jgi:hypothetical protein
MSVPKLPIKSPEIVLGLEHVAPITPPNLMLTRGRPTGCLANPAGGSANKEDEA